jgi:hypothetical protein
LWPEQRRPNGDGSERGTADAQDDDIVELPLGTLREVE